MHIFASVKSTSVGLHDTTALGDSLLLGVIFILLLINYDIPPKFDFYDK